MYLQLQNKVVVVAVGGKGIGLVIVRAKANEGVMPHVLHRQEPRWF